MQKLGYIVERPGCYIQPRLLLKFPAKTIGYRLAIGKPSTGRYPKMAHRPNAPVQSAQKCSIGAAQEAAYANAQLSAIKGINFAAIF